MNLSQNTILITGGTSGLGYEFARQLLALGNTVLITGRDQARLNQTRQQLPDAHVFQSDVSDPVASQKLCAEVIARFPKLNVLINNAGEMRKLNLNDPALDVLDVTRELDINLGGPIRLVQLLLPHLRRQPTAAILNVSSGLALVPYPLAPVYGATKAGLHSYTQALRVQLRGTSVRVLELLAPAADTPLSEKFADSVAKNMLMDPAKVVAAALKGWQHDKAEVYPGAAKAMRVLSRLAPGFLLGQFSKPVAKEFGRVQP